MPIDRGLFNDDQLAVIDWLAEHPEQVCACGWYSNDECSMYCPNTAKRDERKERLAEKSDGECEPG
jgi:hypothetical protein